MLRGAKRGQGDWPLRSVPAAALYSAQGAMRQSRLASAPKRTTWQEVLRRRTAASGSRIPERLRLAHRRTGQGRARVRGDVARAPERVATEHPQAWNDSGTRHSDGRDYIQ